MATDSGVEDDVVHVTSKGQATIPAHLRARFGITAPGRVRFHEEGGRLVVRPVRSAADMMGSLTVAPGASLSGDLRTERKQELEREERRVRRE